MGVGGNEKGLRDQGVKEARNRGHVEGRGEGPSVAPNLADSGGSYGGFKVEYLILLAEIVDSEEWIF